MYPPYPEGFFKNPQMRSPYSYQNGGDWCWFGGRMIQALIELANRDGKGDEAPILESISNHLQSRAGVSSPAQSLLL